MGFMKKAQGSISIFLAVALTVMMILTGVLVDGARIRAGDAEIQGAVSSAAKSSLAGYDFNLKEWFGLFALAENNPDNLREEVENYINKTLMTELGADKKALGDKGYDYLKKMMIGKNEFDNVKFFNLFDYQIDSVDIKPVHNLAENEVMKTQLVEYMKYRAPLELAEGFLDKLMSFKELGKQSGIMKDKINVDKKFNEINDLMIKLAKTIEEVNKFNKGNHVQSNIEKYEGSIYNRIASQRSRDQKQKELDALEVTKNQLQDALNAAKNKPKPDTSSTMASSPKPSGHAAPKSDTKVVDPVAKEQEALDKFMKEKYNPVKTELDLLIKQIDDEKRLADSIRDDIIKYIEPYIQFNRDASDTILSIMSKAEEVEQKITIVENRVKGDATDFGAKMKSEMESKRNQVDKKVLTAKKTSLDKNISNLEAIVSLLKSVDHEKIMPEASMTSEIAVKAYIRQQIKEREIFQSLRGYTIIEYKVILPPTDKKEKDPRKKANDAVKNSSVTKEAKEIKPDQPNIGADGKVKEFPKENLPSQDKDEKASLTDEIIKEDLQFIKQSVNSGLGGGKADSTYQYNGNDIKSIIAKTNFTETSESKDSFSDNGLGVLSGLGSALTTLMGDSRDNLYVNEYVMNTFKNSLTDKFVTEKDGYGKLRPADVDIRNKPMAERKTFFPKSEVEYILIGAENEKANEFAVKGQIFLIRFALNTLHVYMDPVKNSRALQAATAIAGWTGFGIPIVHTMIMLGWAMAESVIDMNNLMKGKKVPIYKLNTQWELDFDSLINGAFETAAQKAVEEVGEVVDYGTSKVNEIAGQTTTKLEEIIKNKIGIVVDNAFQPVEKAVIDIKKTSETKADELTKGLEEKIDNILNSESSSIEKEESKEPGMDALYQVKNEIIKAVRSEIKGKLESIKGSLISQPIDRLQQEINTQKTNLRDSVYGKVEKYKADIDAKINKVVTESGEKAKAQLNSFIDNNLSGKSSPTGSTKNNVKDNLLSLSYQDYLRIFLFVMPDKSKMNRIQDLIQLNMIEEGKTDFLLSNYNTYVRVKASVSMKYFFMTQAFIPEQYKRNGRHQFDVLVYQGY